MKRTLLSHWIRAFVIIPLFLFALNVSAQTTYTWQGGTSGSWSTAGNWVNGVPANNITGIVVINVGGDVHITDVPAQSIGRLQITDSTSVLLQPLNGGSRTLTIGAAVNDALVIAAGSALDIRGLNSSNRVLLITLANTAGLEADISGTLKVSNDVVVGAFGHFTKGASAVVRFNDGSLYHHDINGALTIPTAIWHENSECRITGLTAGTTLAGISGQSFGKFTYDCQNQGNTTVLFAMNGTTTTIKGDFSLESTGAGTGLVCFKSAITTASTVNILGDMNISNGILHQSRYYACNTTVSGNYNQSGGQVFLATVSARINQLFVTGDFNFSAGTFNLYASSTSYYGRLFVTGNYNQSGTSAFTATALNASNGVFLRGVNKNYTQGGSSTVTSTNFNYYMDIVGSSLILQNNIDVASGRSFNITNGILNMGNNLVTGAGTFALTNNANTGLGIGHPQGITTTGATGNIQTTTRTSLALGLLSHFIYNGTTGQVTGNACAANHTGFITVNLSDAGALTFTNTAAIGSGGRLRMVRGSLANAITYNAVNSTLEYTSTTGAQTTTNNEFPAATGPTSLAINNADGVTLHAARTLPNVTASVFTLTEGLLNTTSTNILTISNTTTLANAVQGGSATSYVNGPMRWSIPSATLTGTLRFPVGKTVPGEISVFLNGASATGAVLTLRGEYFEANHGGTAGTTLSALNTTKYWSLQRTAGTGVLNNVKMSLTTPGILSDSKIAYSSTIAGTYQSIGGTGPGSSITSTISTSINATTPNAYSTLGTGVNLSAGTYSAPSLTAVSNILKTSTVTGNVIFELPTTYNGTTDEPSFPVEFIEFQTDGPAHTVTIRPASGSTNFLTAGDPGTNTSLIDLNGIDRLTIDGRAAGSGPIIWTFRNTRTATIVGPTFRLVNDATYNTLTYLNVEGQNITPSSGLIFFNGTTGTLGNSNNTISYCHIRKRQDVATLFLIGINSTGTVGIDNANNLIDNNHVYDNFINAASGRAIQAAANNNSWTITNNHIYQTDVRLYTSSSQNTQYGIVVTNTAIGSDNFTISGNYIGGREAFTGGLPYTMNINIINPIPINYVGIHINTHASASNNVVSGNFVRNFTWQRGSITANEIAFAGIQSWSAANLIQNNIIKNIDIDHRGTTTNIRYAYGIHIFAGTPTVQNNTIDSLRCIFSGGSLAIAGIAQLSTDLTTGATIDGNTISNLTSIYNSTSVNAWIRGIYTNTTGKNTIIDNTIYGLKSNATMVGTASGASVVGIAQLSTSSVAQNISGNTIHSLSNGITAANLVHVVGCFFNGSTTASALSRNSIHSIGLYGTGATASITGMYINSGLVTVANNMIRLGIDSTGTAIPRNYPITGILHVPITANSAYYFNSIYIGGSGVGAGTNNTYAFQRSAASGTINIKNNIFDNSRSNGAGTGNHVAIGVNAYTGFSASGDNCDYNIFNTPGTNGHVGFDGTNYHTTLNDWQASYGTDLDLNSLYGPAQFINATGNAAAVNLHINTAIGTQVESAGTYVGDFGDLDGDVRFGEPGYAGTGTQPDMGADEGEFLAVDLGTPSISYTPIPMQSTLIGPALEDATINDPSGVNFTAGTKPRLYYKLSTHANTYVDNTNATNGWKWVEASNTDYDFTIDYSLLFGGSASPRDIVEYFVVAQDLASTPNVGIASGNFDNPAGVTHVADYDDIFPVSGSINSYAIGIWTGTVNVGTGEYFESLTNDGGLFQSINNGALSGDFIANITSDLTSESGTHALNQWTEISGSGYTLTIRPNNNTNRLIQGNYSGTLAANAGLIRLDGADRVIIDGRDPSNLSADGMHLLFRNTNNTTANNSTFTFINDAANNVIRNVSIEGATTSSTMGVVLFSTSTGTIGNSNNTITNCHIRDRSDAIGTPLIGIYALGSFGVENSQNIISNNKIFNFWGAGAVACRGIFLSTYNSEWKITGNSFYQTETRTSTGAATHFGIFINNSTSGLNFLVENNFVGGTEPLCGGSAWTQNGSANSTFVGIQVNSSTSSTDTILSNTVSNINWRCGSNATIAVPGIFCGIYKGPNGGAIMYDNTVGSTTGTGSITVTTTTTGAGSFGLAHISSSGNINITNNKVGSFTVSGSGTTISHKFTGIAVGQGGSGTTRYITGNIVGSLTTPNSINASTASTSTTSQYVYGITNTIGANALIISNNTVANLNNNVNTTTAGCQTIGILTPFGVITATGNEVFKLNNAATLIGTGSAAAAIGISNTSTAAGHTFSENILHSITSSAASAATNVVGFFYNGTTTGTNRIEKNFIHSLSMATSSATTGTTITGLHVNSGLVNVANNMIRLGVDADGNDVNGNYLTRGILHVPTTANSVYYYNSVYIGGQSVGTGSNKTYAFNRSATSGTITLRNNIFFNNRSNGTGTGRHFAIGVGAVTGLSSNYNLLYAPGTNGTVGEVGTTPYDALADWQGVAGTPDLNSISDNPNFLSANGSAPTVDLHLNTALGSPVSDAGLILAGTWGDYDGEVRAGEVGYLGTSTDGPDIGADEGEFNVSNPESFVWQGTASNAWSDIANWRLADASPATRIPNNFEDEVLIDNTYTPSNWPLIADGQNYTVKDITVAGGATLTIGEGATGQLNVFGIFTNTASIVCAEGSTVNFTGTDAQTVPALNYANLRISGTRAANDVTLQNSGTIGVSGALNLTAAFTSGGYITTGSTINYNGAGSQTVTTQPTAGFYRNIILSNSGNKTLEATTLVNGNLTISDNAVLVDNGFLLSGPGVGSGALTMTNNGTLTMTNTNTTAGTGNNASSFPLFQTYNLAATSTVNYNGNAAQEIYAVGGGYGSLGTTANTKTAAGAFTVKGSLTVGVSTNFYYGAHTITVNGNISNGSVINGAAGDPLSGKILITGGSAAHTMTSTATATYGNVEINDATYVTNYVGTGAATYNGDFTVTNGTFNATGIAVTYHRNIVNNGILDASAATGVYTLNTNAKSISGTGVTTFNILTVGIATEISAGHTVNVEGNAANNFTVSAVLTNKGTLNSNGTAALAGASTIVNDENANFNVANTTIGPALTPSTDPNTVTYIGAATQTVRATTTNPYYHLAVDKTGTNPLNVSTGSLLLNVTGDVNMKNGLFTLKSGTTGTVTVTVGGKYRQTGGEIRLTQATSSGTGVLNVADSLLLLNGILNLSASTSSGIGTINASGDFYHIDGEFTTSSTTSGACALNLLGLNKTYTQTGGIVNNTRINYTVNSIADITLNNDITLGASSRSFNNSGILRMGTRVISGGAGTTFTNSASGTLHIGSPDGIALPADGAIGNIQTATRTFSSSGTYVYDGTTGSQITGSALTTIANLIIDNADGVTIGNLNGTAQTVTVTVTPTLTNGDFNIAGSAIANNTFGMNGTSISGTATNLKSTQYSNLRFGGAAANNNSGLFIPSSITDLNSLTMNINGANTVDINSNINLHAAANALVLTATNGGRLGLGEHNLTILSSATAAVSGTPSLAAGYVVADGAGQLRKRFGAGATAAFTFPIGDVSGDAPDNNPGADYSPFTITMSANDTERIIGVNLRDTLHPNDGTLNDNISRYWSFSDSEAGNGTYTYNGTFTYSNTVPSDLIGIHANVKLNRWNGSAWIQNFATTGSTPNLIITAANETSFPLGGNSYTGRVNAAQPYVWQPKDGGTHDFQDPNNWLPIRLVAAPNDVLEFSRGDSSIAYNVPSQTIQELIINDNTAVTFEAATVPAGAKTLTVAGLANATSISIENGSTLTMGGTVQLLLTMTGTNQAANIAGLLNINNNGTLNNTLITSGTATNVFTVTGTINNNGGIVTATAASLVFANGSFYNHNMNGGTIPIATYFDSPTITTSTVNITGIVATNPTIPNLNFGYSNFTWNNAGQTSNGAVTAFTVHGNLRVLAGTLFDNGVVITGNATGTFEVANGATFRTSRTALPILPNFSGANVVLGATSTIAYAGATHNIPNNPTNVGTLTNYGILAIEGNVLKTLTTPISVSGLRILGTIAACILNDGGNLITGPGAGSGTFFMNPLTVFTTTNTNTNPFPLFQTYEFAANSTVNYNALTTNQNIRNLAAPGYGIVNIIANAGVKSLTGETNFQGTLTVNAATQNTTLDLNGFTLRSSAATPLNALAASVFTANADSSIIHLVGNVAQTLTIASTTITGGVIDQITSSNTHASGALLGTALSVRNLQINSVSLFNLNGRAINIAGTYTNNGTLIGNAAASVLALNGSSAQSFDIGTYTSNLLTGLTINNTAGVTLNAPVNVGTLTLTAGILNATSTNFPTIAGTAVANLVGGSATEYINGPLARTLPTNFNTAGTYFFPIANEGSYNAMSLINPRTSSAAGNVVIKAESFNANASGSAGIGVASLSTNRHWRAELTANAANLTQAGRIDLFEPSVVNGQHITFSPTQSGTYNLMASSVSGDNITTLGNGPTDLGYFVIGDAGTLPGGTYTVGSGGQFPSFTNAGGLFDVINATTITGDITANVISNINNETGSVGLNEWTESPINSNYTLRIQPSAATLRTIEGGYNGTNGINTGLFRINGADRVTIDGRFGGSGKYLLFRNNWTSSWSSTLSMVNGAENNTVTHAILEGGTPVQGLGFAGTDGVVHVGGVDNVPVAPSYTPSTFSTTFSSIAGLGSSFTGSPFDNVTMANMPIGITFPFGGNNYTSVGVNSNGYIFFGTGSTPSTTGTDVLATPNLGANVFGVIAPLGMDLIQHPNPLGASVRVYTVGSVCTIEWIGLTPKSINSSNPANNHRLDFQLKLHTNGNVEFIYKDQTFYSNTIGYSFQAGIRGVSSSDFLCQTQPNGNLTTNSTSAGMLNTDKINFDDGDYIAGDVGIRFTYAPLSIQGNKNLTFSNLDIRSNTASGSAAPVNGFYSQGTALYPNSDITIDSCNIYNFDWGNASSGGVSGIKVTDIGNGSNWTITNNNIYRSSTPGNSLGGVTCINFIPGIGSSNNTITGNFIGGSAAGASGTWPNNNASDPANTLWTGIQANVGNDSLTNISNNTIRKVLGISPFHGIRVGSGSVNIDNNLIDNTGTNYGGGFTGIRVAGAGTVNVTRNQITNITLPVTAPSGGVHNFTGIFVSDGVAGTMVIGGLLPEDGNLINNITNTYNNNSLSTQSTEGIYEGNTINPILIANNTVSNMIATAGTIIGIRANNWASAAQGTVTNNTVFNLNSSAITPIATADAGRNTVITGIYMLGNVAASGNKVYNLNSTAASADVAVTGMFYHPVFAGKVLEKNFVHSLSLSTTSAAGRIIGIAIGGPNGGYIPGNLAASTTRNNMVRLGIDGSGNSLTNGIIIRGVQRDGTAGQEVNNNSIYVGGIGVSSNAAQTVAFRRLNSAPDNIRNNIFTNARSNTTGGTGKHYAIDIGGSNASLVLDYNIYSNFNTTLGANATDAHLFLFGGNPVRDRLPVWFLGANVWGSDNNSGYGDPNFVNPTAAIPDLHLNAANPAEGKGVFIASVTDDFDGEVRSENTPTDIGADAGNFNTPIVGTNDVYPPRVYYTPLITQPVCGGVLTATITDSVSGVPVSGTHVPQIWYRRIQPDTSSWTNNSGTLMTGDGNNGTWDFEFDYSLISPPITPDFGDRYEYYVVVQDQALNPVNPNIGFNVENFNNVAVHTDNDVLLQASAMPTPYNFELDSSISEPVITLQPITEQSICTGSTVSIDIEASAQGLTYQWQYSSDGGTTWNDAELPDYTGADTDSLSFTANSSLNNNLYRVIVNSSCASPVNSEESLLNVEFPGLWLGSGTDWDTPANWGCGILPTSSTDVLIPTNPINGNVFPEIGSNNTSVSRNLTIETGATVNVSNTNDLSIYGNLTNNGTANLGQGSVRMRSNATQIIDGVAEIEFSSLVIDNTTSNGSAVELNQGITVLNQLVFESGKLHLNSNDIDLLGTGVIVNENNANRIYGDQGEVKTIINMEANTSYENISGLGVSISTSATAPGETVIERGHFQHTHLGSYQSIQRYYDINPSVNTALNATLKMSYLEDELEVTIGPPQVKANLLPWRSTDNGETWEGQFIPESLSNNSQDNWVQLSNIPAFSRWTLSDWVDQPLPIQLLSFTATANYSEQTVSLKWITASETNNAFYTVERSNDAAQFHPILTQNGSGNSNTVITYTDIDPNPLMGISYYRLKQTDFNGNSSNSDIAPVNFVSPLSQSLNAFAGEKGTIRLNYYAIGRGNLDVKLYDAGGRLIGIYNFQTVKGSNQLVIDGLNLAPGVYIIQANNGERVFFDKLMMK